MGLTGLVMNFLTPPLPFIALIVVGVACTQRRFGKIAIYTGLALLIACFIPAVGILASLPLIPHKTSWPSEAFTKADAIVVPTAGYFSDDVKFWPVQTSLKRANLGIKLQQETQLPLVLTGGITHQGGPAEADVLHAHLNVAHTPILIERKSTNSYEHATNLSTMFEHRDVHTIVLVTSAMHMARAAACFRALGFDVIPFSVNDRVTNFIHHASVIDYILPSWEGIIIFRRMFYSYAGILSYVARGWIRISDVWSSHESYLAPEAS